MIRLPKNSATTSSPETRLSSVRNWLSSTKRLKFITDVLLRKQSFIYNHIRLPSYLSSKTSTTMSKSYIQISIMMRKVRFDQSASDPSEPPPDPPSWFYDTVGKPTSPPHYGLQFLLLLHLESSAPHAIRRLQ